MNGVNVNVAAVRAIVTDTQQLAARIEARLRDLGPVAVHIPDFNAHVAWDHLVELQHDLRRMEIALPGSAGLARPPMPDNPRV